MQRTLNMSVEETPEEADQIDGALATPSLWAVVLSQAAINASLSAHANDTRLKRWLPATVEFQRAIDRHLFPVVYMLRSDYLLNSTVSIGLDATTHVMGMQSTIATCGPRFEDPRTPTPAIEINDSPVLGVIASTAGDTIWIEDLSFFQYTDSPVACSYQRHSSVASQYRAPAGSIAIAHRSRLRSLVLRHVSFGGVGKIGIQLASVEAVLPGIRPLFIEDSYGGKVRPVSSVLSSRYLLPVPGTDREL